MQRGRRIRCRPARGCSRLASAGWRCGYLPDHRARSRVESGVPGKTRGFRRQVREVRRDHELQGPMKRVARRSASDDVPDHLEVQERLATLEFDLDCARPANEIPGLAPGRLSRRSCRSGFVGSDPRHLAVVRSCGHSEGSRRRCGACKPGESRVDFAGWHSGDESSSPVRGVSNMRRFELGYSGRARHRRSTNDGAARMVDHQVFADVIDDQRASSSRMNRNGRNE